MTDDYYDLCVIGGGINGAGIARDAAGRGLKVLLLEAEDLAGATSSSSTKLIHGGLRYLEYYEFKLVRESLKERETLLSMAPHVIWPMEFILPHTPEQRPAWMIRLGLFLYDHLAKREKLDGSKGVNLSDDTRGASLKDTYKKGFSYADCWADDSRLVVLNAQSAVQKGATILTRHACTKIVHEGRNWSVHYHDKRGGDDHLARCGMVINAAGPWVRDVLDQSQLTDDDIGVPSIRLVKGSHIIVRRQYEGAHAFILQQSDNRIIFAIPYEQDYTLIGTTEEEFSGDARDSMISDDEMAYLVDAYNASFKTPITKDDVEWTYSGVRPLFDEGGEDATKATRDYKLYEHAGFDAPMISVFGGKLTTYRKLAEAAVNRLVELSGRHAPAWSASEPLPGGDIDGDFDAFLLKQGQKYKWLGKALLYRYARSYGTSMDVFLAGANGAKDLGVGFGGDVYECEVLYLLKYEFAQTAEDILWRRSKLGMHVGDDVVQKVSDYVAVYHKGNV